MAAQSAAASHCARRRPASAGWTAAAVVAAAAIVVVVVAVEIIYSLVSVQGVLVCGTAEFTVYPQPSLTGQWAERSGRTRVGATKSYGGE